MNKEIAEFQETLARALIADATDDWRRIILDVEAGKVDGYDVENIVHLVILQTDDGDWLCEDQIPPDDVIETTSALREAYSKLTGDCWSICILTVENTGKYSFDFSYDQPKRLLGTADEAWYERTNNYLKLHRHEL
ncbi:MAG: hypothetical protein KDB82_04645 [Planctomycetes bacterium]|nr:hypothetical protein [Planctomycetota bacterium]